MTPYVVDASVVAAVFFDEEHSPASRRLMNRDDLCAPDLVFIEIANVIWKHRRRGEIDGDEASGLMAHCRSMQIRITPSDQLIAIALDLAMQTDRAIYDCLYLALAIQLKTKMVTNDKRLLNALSSGPLKGHIAWIGDERFA